MLTDIYLVFSYVIFNAQCGIWKPQEEQRLSCLLAIPCAVVAFAEVTYP